MLDIGSLNFPLPPRTILQQITKNLKLCTHVCIRLWNIQFHCTFHRVQSARSINSKSLLLSLFLVFSKRGTDFINGERMFAVFKESARQKNARDRFELFMKLLAAFRRKEKEAGIQGRSFNFSSNEHRIFPGIVFTSKATLFGGWLRTMIHRIIRFFSF